MITWEDFPYRDHFRKPKTPVAHEDKYPIDFAPRELRGGEDTVMAFGAETVGKRYFTIFRNANAEVVYGECFDELYSSKEQNSNDWYTISTDNLCIKRDFVLSRCHGWSAGAADLFIRYVIT